MNTSNVQSIAFTKNYFAANVSFCLTANPFMADISYCINPRLGSPSKMIALLDKEDDADIIVRVETPFNCSGLLIYSGSSKMASRTLCFTQSPLKAQVVLGFIGAADKKALNVYIDDPGYRADPIKAAIILCAMSEI